MYIDIIFTGIAFIYSAQSNINDADWKKQIIWVAIGFFTTQYCHE